jgi:porin
MADLPDPAPQVPLSVHPQGGNPAAEAEPNPHLLPDSISFRPKLNDHGIDYSIGYAVEVLGNTSGGQDRGVVSEGLLKLQLDLDTEGMGLWRGGQFHASALYTHGDSLTQRFTGDLFTFSNLDAPDAFRLFEFWFQQALIPDRLTLRVGQLAADEEFAGTEHGCLFINGTCGWPAILALNVPSPAYPIGTLGARLELTLDPGWTLRGAVYNGDPYPLTDDGSPENGHGTHFDWQDSLTLIEVRKSWNDGDPAAGLPGSAKIGAWYHSGLFEHPRYDTQGLPLADPTSHGEPEVNRGHWGGYIAFDQQVWRETGDSPEQGLAVFGRGGRSGRAAAFGLVGVHREGVVAAAAGMRHVVGAAAEERWFH